MQENLFWKTWRTYPHFWRISQPFCFSKTSLWVHICKIGLIKTLKSALEIKSKENLIRNEGEQGYVKGRCMKLYIYFVSYPLHSTQLHSLDHCYELNTKNKIQTWGGIMCTFLGCKLFTRFFYIFVSMVTKYCQGLLSN